MTSLRLIAAIALVSTFIISSASAQLCSYKTLKPRRSSPGTAPDWEYSVVHNKFIQPRTILFDTEGALLVMDGIGGIIHVQLDDSDPAGGRCVRMKKKKTLLKKDTLTHGLALSKDGRTIYASSPQSVFSYSYEPVNGTLDKNSEKVVIDNMANDGHTWRSLLISQKNPDMLIVSRGSGLRSDPQAEVLSSGHAQIRAFNISALDLSLPDTKPYDFANDGVLLGWGLRNALGLAEHPVTGGIFSTESSYEVLDRDGKDISVDNPGDEMNFHGYLNGSTESSGGNYGYPFCYSLWSVSKFPGLGGLKIGQQFGDDRQSEHSRRTDEECQRDYVAPVRVFQAQSAPLDLEFNQDGTRAAIAFHGSCKLSSHFTLPPPLSQLTDMPYSGNRHDPVGYQVAINDFKEGQPVIAAIGSTNATHPIIFNKNIKRCNGECFRPVSLAWDKKNRLFFSSDKTHEVFVLYNTREAHEADKNSTKGPYVWGGSKDDNW
ncbi:L-sorbosone dehydrogenase [Fusarium mundagurra]|uniref:L-sorbosone dehydrogenase n=1 Tax=Fusarium mundagurra TaxID=1567541 RepID=A0A8H6D5B3_9HYPO|nr:L-sorbosone dehydrogenase [Fusarium mundagurra]